MCWPKSTILTGPNAIALHLICFSRSLIQHKWQLQIVFQNLFIHGFVKMLFVCRIATFITKIVGATRCRRLLFIKITYWHKTKLNICEVNFVHFCFLCCNVRSKFKTKYFSSIGFDFTYTVPKCHFDVFWGRHNNISM